MPTAPIIATVSGATFSVNTTGAELDTVLTIRDFLVLENGVLTLNPLSYTKTTPNSITYSGPTLPSTTLEIRRSTPRAQRTIVLPGTKVRSSDWNLEFDRRVRIQEEIDLYGAGGGFNVRLPVNTAYGIAWQGDTLFSPTRQALYNQMQLYAPLVSPVFTGNPTGPTPLTNDNSTSLATTAFVRSNLGLQAPLASPAFTGTPTVPTAPTADNSTTIASTAHVKNNLALYLPLAGGTLTGSLTGVAATFTGAVTVPTVATADNSTLVASTAHVKSNLALYGTLASPAFTGVPTVPTAVAGTNTTQIASTAYVTQRSKPLLIASRITTTQPLSVTVENPLIWNNAIRDTDSVLNLTTGVITLPRVGFYSISCLAFYSGTSSIGSLSIIEGATLNRLIRLDFRGNASSAIVFSGSTLFYNAVAGTQIRISISDLTVAGTLINESNSTVRNSTHISLHYLGVD